MHVEELGIGMQVYAARRMPYQHFEEEMLVSKAGYGLSLQLKNVQDARGGGRRL